jgi:predicted nucleic acid-binding protein
VALDVRLIIVDASPLITLAAGGSLDYLLLPDIPLIIPDAVFYEATAAADRLGAVEILDWYRAHVDRVRVEPTQALRNALLLPDTPRNLGEQAALEVVRESAFLGADGDRALILTDDRDAQRLL